MCDTECVAVRARETLKARDAVVLLPPTGHNNSLHVVVVKAGDAAARAEDVVGLVASRLHDGHRHLI